MRALNKIIFLSFCFSILLSGNAFASWQKDDTGFWWDNGDGSYPAGKWQWIDGNQDGTAECYYFDDKGYMLENTVTPDSYTVDESGAWTVDGVVQKRITESESDFSESGHEYKVGDISFNPSGRFSQISADFHDDGSLYIVSADGSSTAVIMNMDLESDAELREKVELAEDLGIDFNSQEMQNEFNEMFTSTFISEFGEPESISDSSFNSGNWRWIHYGDSYYSQNGLYVDILTRFYNKTMYSIMLACDSPCDVNAFMNECIITTD